MIFKASDLPVLFGTRLNRSDPRASWDATPVKLPLLPEELQCGRYFRTFNVPVEVVVSSPQFIVPKLGRVWQVDFVLYCKLYVPRELAQKRPMFERGTRDYAWIAERYEDHGDDGHTHYALEGYALIAEPEDWCHPDVNYWAKHLPEAARGLS